MSFVSGNALGRKLCEALGIDTRLVCSITVKCSVGHVATVDVVSIVDDEGGAGFVETVQMYRLSPIEEAS